MAIDKENQVSASVILDKEVYAKFKQLCKYERRSVSSQIALLIEKYMNEYEESTK